MNEERNMIKKRDIFTVIAHFACFVTYAHRFNFSVALVGMVTKTHLPSNETSYHQEYPDRNAGVSKNSSVARAEGRFNWSEKEQGLLLGGFFHGYTLTLLFGGVLLSKYRAKSVFGFGIMLSSVLTLITPVAAKTHFYFLYTVRFLIGCSQGASFPAVQAVLGRWAPAEERSRMGALIYSGMETGSVGALVLGGLLCSYVGWSSVFYVFGGVGVVLFSTWMIFLTDSPDEHPSISFEEKSYILNSKHLDDSNTKESRSSHVPWKKIFLSGPVWAISIAAFSHNWVYYLAVIDIPSYFKNVFDMHIATNGLVSGLPYVFAFITQVIGGFVADFMISKGVSVTRTRKVVTLAGFCPTAVCLYLVGYVGCNGASLSILYIVLVVGLANFSYGGYGVNQMDLSSRFAGIIWSITGFVSNISGGITPMVTGFITNSHPTQAYYRMVFMIAVGVSLIGAVGYLLLASGEDQNWSKSIEYDGSEELSNSEHAKGEKQSLLNP